MKACKEHPLKFERKKNQIYIYNFLSTISIQYILTMVANPDPGVFSRVESGSVYLQPDPPSCIDLSRKYIDYIDFCAQRKKFGEEFQ